MASYFQPELPPIAITVRDSEQLARLASAATGTFPRTADFLSRELDRAQLISDAEIRAGLVMMGSWVKFRDDTTGRIRHVQLVYPDAAAIEIGKISVLSPIGAALIGLSVSQSIEFASPSGGVRRLTVLSVQNQKEEARAEVAV